MAAAVDSLNGVYSGYLAVAVVAWIVTGTFEAYLLFQSGVPMGRDAVHILFLITVQQVSCIAMFVQGSRLNYEVVKSRKLDGNDNTVASKFRQLFIVNFLKNKNRV